VPSDEAELTPVPTPKYPQRRSEEDGRISDVVAMGADGGVGAGWIGAAAAVVLGVWLLVRKNRRA